MLSRIRQKRTASRDQLRAVLQNLDLLGLEWSRPARLLRPVAANEERVRGLDGAFVWNRSSGEARWDSVDEASEHLRVTLCPDEGPTLYSAYQFALANGMATMLIRDELTLACIASCPLQILLPACGTDCNVYAIYL